MIRSVRTKFAAGGFSMVELLVTIIILGIVFAGMVPLFANVLGKGADDNMRNISAILAQDKIERLRQLDYMEITVDNLNSATFKSEQFGQTVPYQTGSGTKTFQVRYTVATFPSDATALTEQYKEVSVDVFWDAPPSPVKHVYQVARVYRQYAGPSVSLGVTPTPDADGAIFDPTAPYYVTLTATVPAAWRGTTNGVAATSKVSFAITLDDVSIDSQDVLTTNTTLQTNAKLNTYQYLGAGVYKFTWVGAKTATLGLYKFTVVGYASDAGSAGEETGLYASLESYVPDPPTGLQAFPGVKQVALEWDSCPHGLFDHFEIWRSTISGQAGSMIATLTDNENPTYTDTTAAAGTKYYYSLKAVTLQGATYYTGLACPQVSATPKYELTDDKAAPSTPTLKATMVANQPTINLTWTASVDNLPVALWQSGMDHYAIYRSSDGATWGVASTFPLATATSWSDTAAGYSKKWYYKIAAYDLAGNFSTSAVVNATTGAAPTYTLTVTNANKSKIAYVWVRDMVTNLYYTTGGTSSLAAPTGTKVDKNKKTAAFTKLLPGSYQVYANFNGTAYVSTPVFSATGSGPYVCQIQ